MKPGKERKRQIIAPLHEKQKSVHVHLSTELRKKYNKRAVQIRKDDVVKIMVGKFKGKEGKVVKVNIKKGFVNVENMKIKKVDGKEIYVRMNPSNLVIKTLNINDNKRFKEKVKAVKKVKVKKEAKKSVPKVAKKVDAKKSQVKATGKDLAPKKVVKKVSKDGK